MVDSIEVLAGMFLIRRRGTALLCSGGRDATGLVVIVANSFE